VPHRRRQEWSKAVFVRRYVHGGVRFAQIHVQGVASSERRLCNRLVSGADRGLRIFPGDQWRDNMGRYAGRQAIVCDLDALVYRRRPRGLALRRGGI
jgi:hypothetical protein